MRGWVHVRRRQLCTNEWCSGRESEVESIAVAGRSENENACAVISLDVLAYSTVEGDVIAEQRSWRNNVSNGMRRVATGLDARRTIRAARKATTMM